MPGINIVAQIKLAQVTDAVIKTDAEQNCHGKPHGHMEIQVADGFIKYGQFGHVH